MELSRFTKDVKKDQQLIELLLKDDECFGFFVSCTDISHLNLLKPTGIESIDQFLREGYAMIEACASLPPLSHNEEDHSDVRDEAEEYVQHLKQQLSRFSRGPRIWIYMANTHLSQALIDLEQDVRITDIFKNHRNLWISCLDYLKAKGFKKCSEDVSAHLAKRVLASPMALRKHGDAFVISLLDRLDNLDSVVIGFNYMFVYEEYFGSSTVKSYTALIDYCKKKSPLEQKRYLSTFCYNLVKYIFTSEQYSNQNDKTYDVLRGIIKMCSNDPNFFKHTFHKDAVDDKLANKFKSLEIFLYGV
jgi:hypothetical protein